MDLDNLILNSKTSDLIVAILESSSLENRFLERARITPLERIPNSDITINYFDLLYQARLSRFDFTGALECCLEFIYNIPSYLASGDITLESAHAIISTIVDYHHKIINILHEHPDTSCRLPRVHNRGQCREYDLIIIKSLVSHEDINKSLTNFTARLHLIEDPSFKELEILKSVYNYKQIGEQLIRFDLVADFSALANSYPEIFNDLAELLAEKYLLNRSSAIISCIDGIRSHINPYIIFLNALLNIDSQSDIMEVVSWCCKNINNSLVLKTLHAHSRQDLLEKWEDIKEREI